MMIGASISCQLCSPPVQGACSFWWSSPANMLSGGICNTRIQKAYSHRHLLGGDDLLVS